MKADRRTMLVTLALTVLALFVLPVHLRPDNFPADDSYFYLQIASNIHDGYGTTFNQITPTNGYHPLWMLICLFGFAISGGNRIVAPQVIFGIQQLLAVASVYLAFRLTQRMNQQHGFLAIPILAAFYLTGLYGSEAHINGFLVLVTLHGAAACLTASPGTRSRLLAYTGAVAGLATLARLDDIFLVGPVLVCLVFYPVGTPARLRVWVRNGLFFLLPCCAVVLPYLLWNWLEFGHLMPISGAIKSTFPHFAWHPQQLGALGTLTAIVAVFALVMVIYRGDRLERMVIGVLSVGTLLHAFYVIGFTDGVTSWSWYYVLGVTNLALSSGLFVDHAARLWIGPSRVRVFRASALAVASVLLAAGMARGWVRFFNPDAVAGTNSFLIHGKSAEQRWTVELASWLKANLPPESRLIVYDYPGAIAYLSGHLILPVDGLIGDYEYNDAILTQGISAYLQRQGIEYWLGPVPQVQPIQRPGRYSIMARPGGAEVTVYAPLYRKSAGSFNVQDDNRIFSLRSVLRHPDTPDLALWRLGRTGEMSSD